MKATFSGDEDKRFFFFVVIEKHLLFAVLSTVAIFGRTDKFMRNGQ